MKLMSQFSLQGKTVLITGAGGILGSQFADRCLEAGASIALLELSTERLNSLHEDLSKQYEAERILAIPCDCSQETDISSAFQQTQNQFKQIDVVVNNATAPIETAEAFFSPLTEFTLSEWRRQNQVNLDGCFLVAREAVKAFLDKKITGGSLIQISSIMGVMGHDKRIYEGAEYEGNSINTPVAYAAAKAGVLGLMRWIAVEYADQGIRSNAIAPGGVSSGQNDDFMGKYSARIPMGRMAEREELPGSLLFLASDASSYITGQCLLVDGGLSAW